ncbi:MAG: cofactor-independent phosphoglycerate mutase [Candidatus Omnitrophica bacterium 4484_70.1]|nr:MAG: cofactor-independent phosphoglycerate mutase [Candidatus Omnitrophica bacterium 4484_70.1]
MKYVVIIPDGAADYPLDILEGRTPWEVAETPFIDSLAQEGVVGRVRTIPPGFTPSSDVANLSLLGYEPEKYYPGRGPLEAANLGVELEEKDLALRCNLITEGDGKIVDYSAGHIRDKEAEILIEFLNEKLGNSQIRFYPGKSYRNLLVYKKGVDLELDKINYFAPHDIMGQPIDKYFPQGKNSSRLIKLMQESLSLLSEHQINKVRIDLGENPANMIWLWGCGGKPQMELFEEKFNLKGAVISAVDLIKGIGKIVGLKVLNVKGATGYYDTNYKGKAEAALEVLDEVDFVFIHIEATDEASHNGDLRMKIICIERIDKLVVGTILQGLKGKDFRILIVPDHPTPISKRTHTDEPVPFLIYGKGIEEAICSGYCEGEAQGSSLYFDSGVKLLTYFLQR